MYEITCMTCNEDIDISMSTNRQPGGQNAPNYIGMTRTSVHCRMLSHLQGQKGRMDSNPLHRHDRDKHDSIPQKYKTRILHCEQNILPLCISEALYIEKQINGSSLNEKEEMGRGGIVRLVASRAT